MDPTPRDGSAHYDLLDPAFHADPAPTLAAMRANDPVWWDPVLQAWVLTRHDDVAFAVSDVSLSVDRGGSISRNVDPAVHDELRWSSQFVQRWMVFADPPEHTRLRTAVHGAFTTPRMKQLVPQIERLTSEAIARVSADGAMELMEDVAVPVPALVTAALLGVPPDDVDRLKDRTAEAFALFGAGVASSELVLRSYQSLRAMEAYFAGLLGSRRVRPGDDVISQLVTSADADALTDDDLIGLCITLLAGAFETTSFLVGNGMWALLRHPEQLGWLRRHPDAVAHAVEEIFRFDGPATSVVRTTVQRTEFPSGAVIDGGQNLYCMLYAANRDPARFDDPDRFDVRREDVSHVGLGRGIHFCLGGPLARLEATILLRQLTQLEDLRLDRDAFPSGGPRYVPNLAIRGLDALYLRFAPR